MNDFFGFGSRDATMDKTCKHLKTRLMAVMLLGVGATGCTTITQPINGVPSNRLPPQFFQEAKNNLVPIDFSLLGQEPPRQYVLDKATYSVSMLTVSSVYGPDAVPVMPPVNFPSEKSTLPPSTGFPFTVLEDGTISLPCSAPSRSKV